MAQTLKTNALQILFDGSYRNTNDFGTDASRFLHSWSLALTNGTGSGNANFAWSDQITITSSSSSTIDLSSLTDRFGNAIAPTKIKAIGIRLTSSTDTAASISVGAAASNQWTSLLQDATDLIKIRYQGSFMAMCTDSTGYAVSGTNKSLKILNNSATQSVVVDVFVIGVK